MDLFASLISGRATPAHFFSPDRAVADPGRRSPPAPRAADPGPGSNLSDDEGGSASGGLGPTAGHPLDTDLETADQPSPPGP